MKRKQVQGIAFLLAMFFIALAAVLLATVSLVVFTQAKHIELSLDFDKALEAAEAGEAAARANLDSGGAGEIGSVAAPQKLTSLPDTGYWATARHETVDNTPCVRIRAEGNAPGCTRRIEALYRRGGDGRYSRAVWREVPVRDEE